jgi:hypothetical protein
VVGLLFAGLINPVQIHSVGAGKWEFLRGQHSIIIARPARRSDVLSALFQLHHLDRKGIRQISGPLDEFRLKGGAIGDIQDAQ